MHSQDWRGVKIDRRRGGDKELKESKNRERTNIADHSLGIEQGLGPPKPMYQRVSQKERQTHRKQKMKGSEELLTEADGVLTKQHVQGSWSQCGGFSLIGPGRRKEKEGGNKYQGIGKRECGVIWQYMGKQCDIPFEEPKHRKKGGM